METQNTQEKKQYNVEVVYVDKQRNTVDLQGELEGQFEVVAPANISYARMGSATASLNAFGKVTYLRSTAPKVQRPQSNGFKPYTQKNSFQPGNQYKPQYQSQPKKDVDWEKISFGKVKYGFLIEAFKKGLSLEEAEVEAEKWAKASMRIQSEQDIVKQEIAKVEKVNTQNVNTQSGSQEEKQDFSGEAYSDSIPEESLGYF